MHAELSNPEVVYESCVYDTLTLRYITKKINKKAIFVLQVILFGYTIIRGRDEKFLVFRAAV